MIVNNVIQETDSDFLRRRQSMQQGYLDLLAGEYGGQMTITHLPLFAREIKGVSRLRKVERVLFPS
jgi:hypothetical protein